MLFALTMQSFLLICLVNKFRMYGGFAHLPVILDLKTRKNYIMGTSINIFLTEIPIVSV